MTELMEILARVMVIIDRVRSMEQLSTTAMIAFGVVLMFGVLNCVLGYRLLRFWMMLGGFGVGAAAGFFCAYTLDVQQKFMYGVAMLIGGILLAVIAFLIYKAGVFLLGAGLGWTLSIYIIHPTTSAMFFLCVLIGIGIGSLAVKYCREVLIVITSIVGGIMAGLALGKIGNLAEFPYGIGMSVGFALLGMLIQFAINKVEDDEEEYDEDDDYDEYEDEKREAFVNHRIPDIVIEELPKEEWTEENERHGKRRQTERK